MKLSNDFSLSEFTKSQVAIRKGLKNRPSLKAIANLKLLCQWVLQPLRNYVCDLLFINSGYRSPEVNKAIGGSATSQHCLGEAADIEVSGNDNREVAIWIRDNIKFDQLILEYYKKGEPRSGWVHVSYRKGRNRQQVKRAVKRIIKGKKKTIYPKGL